MEDLDTPRVVAGSAEEILEALRCYGLEWDGEVVWQSRRTNLYEGALHRLRAGGLVFDCGCSRADLQRAASAPTESEAIYPGTCRSGLPPGRAARAIRFRAPNERIAFDDVIHGRIEENIAEETGDFVIKRADGPFAYQLAVVVDDADQGVTQVVRGGDLLSSTARQIALQRALGLPTPSYAHLPLVVGPDGAKLGKRDAALPLPSLDHARVRSTLAISLQILGVDVEVASPREMLEEALRRPFSTSPGARRSSITGV
jgi:glutamyl-Q tRNA(Asp) synthetase